MWSSIAMANEFSLPIMTGTLPSPDGDLDNVISQENAWGYGQIIAVLLLGSAISISL